MTVARIIDVLSPVINADRICQKGAILPFFQ